MMKSRVFTIISLLVTSISTFACWYPTASSRDNMIYRLFEDVSPFYLYSRKNMHLYAEYIDEKAENLALWRKQTKTNISDEKLRWFVYESSLSELNANKKTATGIFGKDGFQLLCIAKECEAFRNYINDPWYYPYKGDTLTQNIKKRLAETTSYRGRYASRYALQAVRILVALSKYKDAVTYWEKYAKSLSDDIVKNMAECHVACAYLNTGDTLTAANIYAKQGDLGSLNHCGLEIDEVWQMVYEHCPNSPFFKYELQALLTHLDNRYYERYQNTDYYATSDFGKEEKRHIKNILRLSDKAIKEGRVKDIAIWYYAKAAILDAIGKHRDALSTVKAGERCCKKGTFLAKSMRVLRIMIEAETSTYNSSYLAKLTEDLKWMDINGRRNITPEIWKKYQRERSYAQDGTLMNDGRDVEYNNTYYWNDVMNRILVDVLSQRMKKEGNITDAMLFANLGTFWIMKNVYGKAESPNIYSDYSTTNLTNAMSNMVDSCSASQIIDMYQHIAHPTRGIDKLVARYGVSDRSYWSDIIGTHLIREKQYAKATRWLKHVSRKYQKSISSWDYYDRNPFCYKIGWRSDKRHHLKNKYDYKLKFAREMAYLQEKIKKGKTADERGEAMIRYGVGLRNQKEWCWALSRYSNTYYIYYASKKNPKEYGKFIDISDSEKMIDKGIATIKDRELKARYLHLFVRNKEVMEYYADTKTAQSLRAHCDLWRDYVKK